MNDKDVQAELLAALIREATLLETLAVIATPIRQDGTWNRGREACQQMAAEAIIRNTEAMA